MKRVHPVDSELHDEFGAFQKWFGYGDPASKMWVVGLEEHCDAADLPARLRLRSASSGSTRILPFHAALLGSPEVQGNRRAKQHLTRVVEKWSEAVPTWRIANAIYRGVFGVSASEPDEFLFFTELLPLPRPNHSAWPPIYEEMPGAPSCAEYKAPAFIKDCARRLEAQVSKHRPQVVLLHGKTAHKVWTSDSLGTPDKLITLKSQPPSTTQVWQRAPTTWVLVNNLVNNGHIHWTEDEMEALASALRDLIRRQEVPGSP